MGCSEFNYHTSTCTQVDTGFDYAKVLTYTDENGDAIDITGFDLNMIIKDFLGGSTILTLPIVGDADTTGFYIPTPSNGEINMQITATDSDIVGGNYPYETTITNPSSKDEIWMQGTIQFVDRGI